MTSAIHIVSLLRRPTTQTNVVEDPNLLKQGKLVKKGLLRSNWKVRYFRLAVGTLTYYESAQDTVPIKSLALRGCQVRRRLDLPQTYAFELCWMNHSSLLLRGASDDDVDDWMLHLKRAADSDEIDAGPTEDDENDSNSPTPSDERDTSTLQTLPTMPLPQYATLSTLCRTSARSTSHNVITSRVDFAAMQRSLLQGASVSTSALPSTTSAPTPAVPAPVVAPAATVAAPPTSAHVATPTYAPVSQHSPPSSSSTLPLSGGMPTNATYHSDSSSSTNSAPTQSTSSSKSPTLEERSALMSSAPQLRPSSPFNDEQIRSTAAHKEPQPLSNQSKLEWLRQAKRELVSEADPLLQYDIDYSARLGKGSFGEVYLATHKVRGEKVAIKQLQISKKNRMEYLLIETDLHARVSNHRNVVRFVDAFLLREEKQFWVVMEFIDGAPLSEVKALEAFAEEQACWVVRNVLDALVYIHHTNRIHRDVKAANVLISVTGEVKLTDFGLAAQLTEEMQYRKTMLGTADFMAPELLRGEAYGCKVDVWALGMMMHEILRGATPFATCTDPQHVLSQIEAAGVPTLKRKKLSALAQKFVDECLRQSPDARPDSATLLEHAWFKSHTLDGACVIPLVQQIKTGDVSKPHRPGDTPTTSGCVVQ